MDIVGDPTKVLAKDFMMGIYFVNMLMLSHHSNNTGSIFFEEENGGSGIWVWSKSAPVQWVEEGVVLPKWLINDATNERLVQLAKVAAQPILNKLRDEKKATWKYLSISGSPVSYQECSKEVKEGLHGREATNDRSESAFGRTTHQLQKIGPIRIANAAAVSDAMMNG